MYKLITLIFLVTYVSAQGSQLRLHYSLGAESAGTVGAQVAEGDNPYAVLLNPAGLSFTQRPQLGLSTAAIGYGFSSAGQSLSRRDTSVWSLGYAYPFKFLKTPVGLGIVAGGPFDHFRSFHSTTVGVPRALNYGTSDMQFQSTLGAGVRLLPWLSAGVGLSWYLTASGAADVTVVTQNPGGNLALDVNVNSAVVLGLMSHRGADHFGLVYHQAMNPRFQQKFDGRVQLGDQDVLQQPVLVDTSLYYEPATVELEWERELGSQWSVSAGVSYIFWGAYRHAYLDTRVVDADGAEHRSQLPQVITKDILSPRLAVVWKFLPRLRFFSGYQYQPSPVVSYSEGALPLDSNTHRWGLGFSHLAYDSEDLKLHWGLQGQFHWIVSSSLNTAAGQTNYHGTAYHYGASVRLEM